MCPGKGQKAGEGSGASGAAEGNGVVLPGEKEAWGDIIILYNTFLTWTWMKVGSSKVWYGGGQPWIHLTLVPVSSGCKTLCFDAKASTTPKWKMKPDVGHSLLPGNKQHSRRTWPQAASGKIQVAHPEEFPH